MTVIDTSAWGDFHIEDLFTLVKGTRLKSVDRIPGDIPYVGASQFNNGITHHIANDEHLHPGGVLTVCYNGPVGTTFYQPERFWATDDVNVLYPRGDIPMEALLFVAPAVEQAGLHYGYTDKWKMEDMAAALIKLPVTSNGEPDWEYMEGEMHSLMEKQKGQLDSLLAIASAPPRKVDVSTWGEFRVGDFFEISRPKARSLTNYIDGDVPFVASGNFNNGVSAYVEPRSGEDLDAGNCITVSPLDGSSFYQPNDFLGRGGAGSAIIILRNMHLTPNTGLFISAAVRNSLTRFSYSDQLNKDSIAEQVFKLPVTDSGAPNWNYMEQAMRGLLEDQKGRLESLTSL